MPTTDPREAFRPGFARTGYLPRRNAGMVFQLCFEFEELELLPGAVGILATGAAIVDYERDGCWTITGLDILSHGTRYVGLSERDNPGLYQSVHDAVISRCAEEIDREVQAALEQDEAEDLDRAA